MPAVKMNEWVFYILVPLVAAGLAVLLTPAAIGFARRHRIYDRPNFRKVHSRPVPRFGGVAVYAASLAAAAAGMITLGTATSFTGYVLPLLAAGTIMLMTGLWDDVCSLSAGRKLVMQCIAAACLCGLGDRIESCVIDGITVTFPAWLSWSISLFWIVGLTNALNFMDGLDGLLAGVSAITCCFLGLVCGLIGQAGLAVYLLAVGGALMGFLLFNSRPARIFLGDGGSLFLGFTLAGASVSLVREGDLNCYLMVGAVFLVPVLDTLLIMLARYAERRSVFSPDQNHFHHRLLRFGCRHRQAVLTIYAITFASLLGGLVILSVSLRSGLLVAAGMLGGALCLFHRVGSLHVGQLVQGLRLKLADGLRNRRDEHRYEAAELAFRGAGSLTLWWKAVCAAAARLDVSRLTLSMQTDAGQVRLRTWQKPGYDDQAQNAFSMKVPVTDQAGEQRYWLQVDLSAGPSNESGGRRLTLFARLIDKYGFIRYPDAEPLRIARPKAPTPREKEVAIA